MIPKSPRVSEVVSVQLMMPEHANPHGNVHGGIIMKAIDEAGGICAMKHAQRPVVTVTMDSMTFLSPIQVGDLVTLTARIEYVGRTSMDVLVTVTAENPIDGKKTHTNSANLLYVALDDDGRPHPVPPLGMETDDDRRRWREGAARQRDRLAAKKKAELARAANPV